MSERFVAVAAIDDIPENGNLAFVIKGHDILICRSEAGLFAVGNRCSHAQSELEGGIVRGPYLFCPMHGARFDLRNGTTASKLTNESIPTYDVRVADGRVEVKID